MRRWLWLLLLPGVVTAGTPLPPGEYDLQPGTYTFHGAPTVITVPGAPPPPTFALTVTQAGTGSGMTTGAGAYAAGAPVTLTATPGANSTFTGWSPAPCGPSFAMPAAALSCTATFTLTAPPPTLYPLTLQSTGSGQGTVASGSGPARRPRPGGRAANHYEAGEPVVLTATPGAGSTFAGWTPAPCAPMFPMPAQALTCVATFTASTPPPTGGGWQRLPTGVDAMDTFSFTSLAWDSQRHQAIATSWDHYPWCLTGNTWATCGQKGPAHDFHNGGYAYDPVNDRHWVSTPSDTMVYWQRATGAYVVHSTGGCGMDPAMIYDPPRQRFVCFGGWSTPTGTVTVATFALAPVAQAWTRHYPALGPVFDDPSSAAKMTFTRAGWDAQRQRIWYVDERLDLWALDPATLTWTKTTTTGTKPDKFAVFARHEAADRIIAWVGRAGIVNSGEPVYRQTYALTPATGVWIELSQLTAARRRTASRAPRPLQRWIVRATEESVPPGVAVADNMMIYDPVNARLLLHTGWNYARETWAFTPTAGPPPTQSFTLTIQTAGTGSGTTTGAGAYPTGTAVALGATPASGSSFGGWSGHADCADASVTMDADKACTATFTAAPPPVAGVCLPTMAKTFSPCVIPAGYDDSPFAADSKDLMWTWDSKRNLILVGMGDNANTYANQSGNNVLWSYDPSTNGWAVVSTFCHAPGTVTPNHPSDYGIMVYDPGRDRVWWLGQGDGFPPGQNGAVCHQGATGWPTGSIRRNGFLWMTPGTNTWTKVSEQATYTIGGSYFDAAGDRALTVETDNYLHAWPMATMPSAHVPLAHLGDLVPSPAYSGATGGWLPTEYPYRVKWAWDHAGRIAYLPLVFRKLDAPGNVVESGVWMVAVNTVTKTVALKARAPIPLEIWLDPYAVMSVWDSVNQKVIYPVMSGACGKIETMLVYHPTTDTWEATPVPTGTHGATVAYDPVRNVVMLGGRVFCEGYTPSPTRLWLWRYGP